MEDSFRSVNCRHVGPACQPPVILCSHFCSQRARLPCPEARTAHLRSPLPRQNIQPQPLLSARPPTSACLGCPRSTARSARLPASLGRYRPAAPARLLMPCPLPTSGAPPRPSRSRPAAHLRAPRGCPCLEGENGVDRGRTRPLFREEQGRPESHWNIPCWSPNVGEEPLLISYD
jgi:hypothetical protein